VLSHALVGAEIARVDASCSTFALVHSSLCMATIGTFANPTSPSLLEKFAFLLAKKYIFLVMWIRASSAITQSN
jgi:hypothetical protein